MLTASMRPRYAIMFALGGTFLMSFAIFGPDSPTGRVIDAVIVVAIFLVFMLVRRDEA
jgi:hypothetical protein